MVYDPRLDYARGETRVVRRARLSEGHDGMAWANTALVYESIYLWTDLDHDAVHSGSETVLDQDRFLFLSYHDKVQVPDGIWST